jgi:hypothetical protein
MAANQGKCALSLGTLGQDEIVELALLLPARRAEALLALARKRRQSVAQILRHLIDQALANEE